MRAKFNLVDIEGILRQVEQGYLTTDEALLKIKELQQVHKR